MSDFYKDMMYQEAMRRAQEEAMRRAQEENSSTAMQHQMQEIERQAQITAVREAQNQAARLEEQSRLNEEERRRAYSVNFRETDAVQAVEAYADDLHKDVYEHAVNPTYSVEYQNDLDLRAAQQRAEEQLRIVRIKLEEMKKCVQRR